MNRYTKKLFEEMKNRRKGQTTPPLKDVAKGTGPGKINSKIRLSVFRKRPGE